jgi:predicted TIM-barrel fold metal-dependent hydrolase
MTRVYFDVSGVAGLGKWEERAGLIASRIRALGVNRVLYGSDGAAGGNLAPREAAAAFRRLPLTEDEFRSIEHNVAPFIR